MKISSNHDNYFYLVSIGSILTLGLNNEIFQQTREISLNVAQDFEKRYSIFIEYKSMDVLLLTLILESEKFPTAQDLLVVAAMKAT